jgi:hypothetical protein
MTVPPEGPSAATVVTDEIVGAAIEAYGHAMRNTPVVLPAAAAERHVARQVLEAVALMIVAAYQHAEEDLLPPE